MKSTMLYFPVMKSAMFYIYNISCLFGIHCYVMKTFGFEILDCCIMNTHINTESFPLIHTCTYTYVPIIYTACICTWENYNVQETESIGSQALKNVEMLTSLISLTLETDDNRSANFSVSGESISE